MDVVKSYISPTRIGQPAVDRRQRNAQNVPSPRWQLVRTFTAWKVLLLVIACSSPGSGYDTSTDIFLQSTIDSPRSLFGQIVEHVVTRLTRWDAIYFVSASHREKVYEQEWAFSWAHSKCSALVARVLPQLSGLLAYALSGIAISHVSHFLSVLVLYQMAVELLPNKSKGLAFKAACLHILSPAGLFLSAPYSEASFALFNFTGMLCYIYASRSDLGGKLHLSSLWTTAAGICFALSCIFRSNGLLSGLIFAWDAVAIMLSFDRSGRDLQRLSATVIAGVITGCGFVAPQIVAYFEYCTAGQSRPWCEKLMPSIYSWVQTEYWNVGFLRYWTLSNLPLFLLAAPMLLVLVLTAVAGLRSTVAEEDTTAGTETRSVKAGREASHQGVVYEACLKRFALPQLVLALLALFNFHVQIITRISSGYPLWYLIVALATAQGAEEKELMPARFIVRGMVLYAIIQGGLYASFLPPA